MLIVYDYSVAKTIDSSGINCMLVGDSLGMAMLGYDNNKIIKFCYKETRGYIV